VSRPADWWVLDLDRDPVPGSPQAIRAMARSWSGLADDAEYAETRVRQLMGDGAIGAWIGEAGEAFRSKTGELPEQLGKCKSSYRLASEALSWWADRLAVHQGDADAALVKGRAAHADLEHAKAQASAASAGLHAASGSSVLADAARYATSPPVDSSLVPTPAQVSAARHRLAAAQAASAAADAAVTAAQSRLDHARALALDAAALRDGDARRTADRIHEAADAGIPERSRWDKLKDWAAEAWHVIITVAKVVVAVLGVIALIIGGPLAWVVFAAALLILADTIMKYMQGKASLWEVALAALMCIPGTKGLTSLAELSAAFKAGGALGALAHIGGAARTAIVEMAAAVRSLGPALSTNARIFVADGMLVLTLRMAPQADRGLESARAITSIHAPNMYLPGGLDVGALHLPTEGPVADLLAGYDRFGGMPPSDFSTTWGNGHGGYNWALVPDDGFLNGERVAMEMRTGDLLDRFGGPQGRFLSPAGTPYAERSLPPSNINGGAPNFDYHVYEVVRPFTADVGFIAPAMGQDGGGLQVFINAAHMPEDSGRVNVEWLLKRGLLRELIP
jgi:hypothetical protein